MSRQVLFRVAVVAVTAVLGAGVAAAVTRPSSSTVPLAPRVAAPRPSSSDASGLRWRLVGLGDSIPEADDCPGCSSYVALYGAQVEEATGADMTVTNLGVGGWTSADLLASVSDDGTAVEAVQDADIVTITIGANDFAPQLDTYLSGQCGGAEGLACFDPALPVLHDNLTAILDRITAVRAGRPTAVRVTGYWDVFVDGAEAANEYGATFLADSAALTRQANDVIADVARGEGADYIDLFTAFKGPFGDRDPTPLLADDGDHPSQAGHVQIADALVARGFTPLMPVPALASRAPLGPGS